MADEPTSPVAEILPKTEILPPMQMLEIDDDNFVHNGEAFFWIGDIKNLIVALQQHNPNAGAIVAIGTGWQHVLPFSTISDRDNVATEIKNRIRAIRNGTIRQYISEQNRKNKKVA